MDFDFWTEYREHALKIVSESWLREHPTWLDDHIARAQKQVSRHLRVDAGRLLKVKPAKPSVGALYKNKDTGMVEIFDGKDWLPYGYDADPADDPIERYNRAMKGV